MPVSPPNIPTNAQDINDLVAVFESGTLHIADGGYTASEADNAFDSKVEMEKELSDKFVQLSDLMLNSFKLDSKADKFETVNHVFEIKRTNTIELYLAGLGTERKAWLEEQLNQKNRTIVVVNKMRNAALIFNNKRWSCDWEHAGDGAFSATLNTKYTGQTTAGYMVYKDIK